MCRGLPLTGGSRYVRLYSPQVLNWVGSGSFREDSAMVVFAWMASQRAVGCVEGVESHGSASKPVFKFS